MIVKSEEDSATAEFLSGFSSYCPLWDNISQDIYNNAIGFDKLKVVSEFSRHMRDGVMILNESTKQGVELINHTGHDMLVASKYVTKKLDVKDDWLMFGSICLSKIEEDSVTPLMISEFRDASISYEKKNYFDAG